MKCSGRGLTLLFWFLLFNCLLTAQGALLSRAGGAAYYDDVLDITWLGDANYALTESFGVSGINANGLMNIPAANAWLAGLNGANHLGVSSWRLPFVEPSYVASVSCSSPPPGDLLCESDEHNYNFLGNGITPSTPDGFTNLSASNFSYWYSTPSGTGKTARTGYGGAGRGNADNITGAAAVWAVADGDVAVPVPAAVWLFGSALGLLGWMRRKT